MGKSKAIYIVLLTILFFGLKTFAQISDLNITPQTIKKDEHFAFKLSGGCQQKTSSWGYKQTNCEDIQNSAYSKYRAAVNSLGGNCNIYSRMGNVLNFHCSKILSESQTNAIFSQLTGKAAKVGKSSATQPASAKPAPVVQNNSCPTPAPIKSLSQANDSDEKQARNNLEKAGDSNHASAQELIDEINFVRCFNAQTKCGKPTNVCSHGSAAPLIAGALNDRSPCAFKRFNFIPSQKAKYVSESFYKEALVDIYNKGYSESQVTENNVEAMVNYKKCVEICGYNNKCNPSYFAGFPPDRKRKTASTDSNSKKVACEKDPKKKWNASGEGSCEAKPVPGKIKAITTYEDPQDLKTTNSTTTAGTSTTSTTMPSAILQTAATPVVNADSSPKSDDSEVQAHQQECDSAKQEAIESCDENSPSNSGALSQIQSKAGQISSSASIAFACNQVAQLANVAVNLATQMRSSCKAKQQQCLSVCRDSQLKISQHYNSKKQEDANDDNSAIESELSSALEPVTNGFASCRSFDGYISQTEQSINNSVASAQNAAACEKAVSTDDICKTHPESALCGNNEEQKCGNTAFAAANQQFCECQVNPNSPNCSANMKTTANNTSLNPNVSKASNDIDGKENIDGLLSNANKEDNKLPNTGEQTGQADEGKKGGATGIGGGGGDGKRSSPQAGKGSGSGKESKGIMSILAGFFGGGSGGGSSSSSSGGSGSGVNINSAHGNQSTSPDLRSFMPGGKNDPKRGIANVGIDGILSPNRDIFKNMSDAIEKQKPTLSE